MKKSLLYTLIGASLLTLSLSACDGLFSSTIISSSSSSEESSQSSETEENPTEPEDPEEPDNPDPDPDPECQHEWLLKYDDSYHWYECSLCGESSTPESHILEESTIDPTCVDTGSYDTYCTVCDYKSHEELPATGEHIWDSGEVTIAPTCESEGEMTYHCTVCQTGLKTESISPLGHDFSGEYQYDESGHWKECLNGCGTIAEQSFHDTVEGEVKTEATCTEDGERYINCTICDFTGTISIAASHTPSEDVIEVAPTCTEDGYRSYTCSVCEEEIEGEVIPALGHDYVSKYDDEYHYEECSRCHEIINKAAHSYDKSQIVESVSPTCQEDGSNSYKCLYCEHIYVEVVEADEAYHDWQVVSSTAPTCVDDGTTSYKCSICKEEKTEISAEKLGHDWATDSQGNYIYTDAGDTHYVACTRCEAKTEEGSHTYPETANNTLLEPTCYQEGSEEYLCIYCNHQDIRSINPTGNHDWYVADSKENTCGEDGYIIYKCQTEGCTETYTQELKATGEHTYELQSDSEGHWLECSVCGDQQEKVSHTPVTETVQEATCLVDGTSRTYCLECYYEISSSVISAVGSHTYEIKDYVEPSCTEEGYYIYGCAYNDMETVKVTLDKAEHTYTSGAVELDEADQESGHHRVCDVCHQAEATITPHNPDSGETIEATCTSPSGTKYTCTDCNYSYIVDDGEETILGHNWDEENGVTIKEPTCTENGEIEYTCTRCDATYSEAIEALGHEYDEGVVTLEPTCGDAGQTTYTCTRCDDSYTLEDIPATGVHTYVEEVIAPTCTEAGYTLYTCSVCGADYQDNPVDALGHDTLGYGCDYDGHWTGGCSRCHYYDGEAYNEREEFHTWAENYDEDGNMYCLTCGYTEEIHLDDFNVYYDDSVSDSEAHIWGYSGTRSEVTIPMYDNGHRITYIEAGDLCEHTEISYVHIPSTLEYLYSPEWLGEGVFQNDTGITHLNIDSGMHDVGENAFYGCTGLTYINLPASIEHINAYAFYDCSALHELVCPDSVSWLGDYAFGGDCGQLDQTYGGIVYWTGTEDAWKSLMYNAGSYDSNYCFCNSYCSRYNENPTEDEMKKWQWRWVGITPTTWGDE